MIFWQVLFVVIIAILILFFIVYKIKKGGYKYMNKSGTSLEFKIDIRRLFSKFEEHLEITGNKRILFSGKFGIGKTYFLKEFFNKHNEKYECYYLSPVNYQISQNEDIIELLKYDILIEIINKNEKLKEKILEDNDYKKLIMQICVFGKNNYKEILNGAISLISWIPKLGRPLQETIGLFENILKFIKNTKKGMGDAEIGEFLETIKKEQITETDYISEFIKKKIQEIKKVNKTSDEKESVLILDDLDRIDPEHIFRILNIFSAHFDLNNKELPNKFGFDKIIIVADYSNLVKIFHHKYGQDTDASGYFNKFFSVEIFQFTPEEVISDAIDDQIISRFQIKDPSLKKEFAEGAGLARIFLNTILTRALKLTGKEKLNMWQLLKGVRFTLPEFEKKHNEIHESLKITINILLSIFDNDKEHCKSVLEKIKQNHINGINQGEINPGYRQVCDNFFLSLLETIKSKESKSLESTNEKHIRLLCQYSNTTYDIDINQVVGINSIRKTKGGSDIASNNDKEKEKFEKFFYECFYTKLLYISESIKLQNSYYFHFSQFK
jgi:hypothetical protein